jgi:hypothetical protein
MVEHQPLRPVRSGERLGPERDRQLAVLVGHPLGSTGATTEAADAQRVRERPLARVPVEAEGVVRVQLRLDQQRAPLPDPREQVVRQAGVDDQRPRHEHDTMVRQPRAVTGFEHVVRDLALLERLEVAEQAGLSLLAVEPVRGPVELVGRRVEDDADRRRIRTIGVDQVAVALE